MHWTVENIYLRVTYTNHSSRAQATSVIGVSVVVSCKYCCITKSVMPNSTISLCCKTFLMHQPFRMVLVHLCYLHASDCSFAIGLLVWFVTLCSVYMIMKWMSVHVRVCAWRLSGLQFRLQSMWKFIWLGPKSNSPRAIDGSGNSAEKWAGAAFGRDDVQESKKIVINFR